MIEAPKHLADCGMFVASAPWKGVPLEQVYADLESEYGRRELLGLLDDAAGLEPGQFTMLEGERWVWSRQNEDEDRRHQWWIPHAVYDRLRGVRLGDVTIVYQSEADAWTALLVALDQL